VKWGRHHSTTHTHFCHLKVTDQIRKSDTAVYNLVWKGRKRGTDLSLSCVVVNVICHFARV
jgi:hypothetical protein